MDVVGLSREVIPVGRFFISTGRVRHALVNTGILDVIPHKVRSTTKVRAVLFPDGGTSGYVDTVLVDIWAR